jgi:hypothetical protein
VLWSAQQAALLRRRAAGELVNETEIDWPNVAEEIDQFGRSQARELASRLASVMVHPLKLAASPAAEPRAGWRATIREQRDEIGRVVADSPSLRGLIPAIIAAEMGRSRSRAGDELADHEEQPRIDLGGVTYDGDQVLGVWFPAPPGGD